MNIAYFEKSTKVRSDLLVVRTNTQNFKKQGIKNVKKQNDKYKSIIPNDDIQEKQAQTHNT